MSAASTLDFEATIRPAFAAHFCESRPSFTRFRRETKWSETGRGRQMMPNTRLLQAAAETWQAPPCAACCTSGPARGGALFTRGRCRTESLGVIFFLLYETLSRAI